MSAAAKTRRSPARLGVGEWRSAALHALADGGIEAVAIEPIAKSLGVTKGSGYWHFENREALLRAALEEWETVTTERVIDKLKRISDPRSRLIALFRAAFSDSLDARVYLSLTAAEREPAVAAVLERVSHRRIEFVAQCYHELGCGRGHARHRALSAYIAYLGVLLLGRHSRELDARSEREAFVEHLIATLIDP